MNSIENNKGIIVCSVCANDSLSIKSNHNSHINKRFDYLVNRSNDFVNRPNDLFNRPNDLVNRPNDLVNRPNDLVNRLNDLFNRPNDLVNRSNDFVNRPNDLVNRPNDLFNRFTLVTKHYVEKLGKQFKDLLKCVDIKDIYLSNYELRFIKT